MQPLVEIAQLVKRYGDFTAVDSLTLSIPRGVIFALLGPNGAGKTTTIKLLMGMLQPTSGTLKVDGLDAFADGVAVKEHVGYLPDEPAFYDFMRGSEIIRFAGEMHGLPERVIQERGTRLAEQLHLAEALGEFAENYSRRHEEETRTDLRDSCTSPICWCSTSPRTDSIRRARTSCTN